MARYERCTANMTSAARSRGFRPCGRGCPDVGLPCSLNAFVPAVLRMVGCDTVKTATRRPQKGVRGPRARPAVVAACWEDYTIERRLVRRCGLRRPPAGRLTESEGVNHAELDRALGDRDPRHRPAGGIRTQETPRVGVVVGEGHHRLQEGSQGE